MYKDIKGRTKYKQIENCILIALLGCFCLFIVLYVNKLPHMSERFNNEEVILLEEGWEYVSKDNEVRILSLPFDKLEQNIPGGFCIVNRIPEDLPNYINTITIWSGMRNVRITIDNEIILDDITAYDNFEKTGSIEDSRWEIGRAHV